MLCLVVALVWLFVLGARANADFVIYDFESTPPGLVSGSFKVNEMVVQPQGGMLLPGDLQNPSFHTTLDNQTFNQVDSITATFRFNVDPNTFSVVSEHLELTSSVPGIRLIIDGPTDGIFSWTEETNGETTQAGTGTWSQTVQTSAVPEPSSYALVGVGGLCLAGYAWRRRRLAVAQPVF
jgi:PEP-CTERM motif